MEATEVTRQILAVAVVLALLAGTLWKLRARPVAWAGPARLASAGRLALTPQHSLHLVRIGGREIVLVTHPHGCSVLSDNPADPTEGA
jgi:hypothetical protein